MTKENSFHRERLIRPVVSIEERVHRFDRVPHPFYTSTKPHVIVRQRGDQLLVLIGGPHSHDPKHQEYPTIDAAWDFFNTETEGKKRKIRYEGRSAPFDQDKESAIKENSEPGALARLSGLYNVEMTSADSLSYNESDKLLVANFKPEDILHYYILREIPQLIDRGRDPLLTPQERLIKALARYREKLMVSENSALWENVTFTPEAIKATHKKHFGMKYDLFDVYWAIEQTRDLASSDTVTQQIARHCNALRDEHLVTVLLDDLDAGESVFGVLGLPHTHAIEKDLEAFGWHVPNDFDSAEVIFEHLVRDSREIMDLDAYTQWVMGQMRQSVGSK